MASCVSKEGLQPIFLPRSVSDLRMARLHFVGVHANSEVTVEVGSLKRLSYFPWPIMGFHGVKEKNRGFPLLYRPPLTR